MNRFIKAQGLPDRVILTDDPHRVRLIGARQLEEVSTLFELRGMFGYLGTYKGQTVAVISVSFGETAALLYTEEAIRLGARELIYLGECISRTEAVALLDVILARGGDPELAQAVGQVAADLAIDLKERDTLTQDTFWSSSEEHQEASQAEVIDFAARAVYRAAAQGGVRAAVILVAAEHTVSSVRVVESVRQSRFQEGVRLALETLVREGSEPGVPLR